MKEYSRYLGDTVKRARGASGLTQREVADRMNKDVRTVLNIENYKGNPKLEVLFPLILVEECSEEEAAAMLPVFHSVLHAIRSKGGTDIK